MSDTPATIPNIASPPIAAMPGPDAPVESRTPLGFVCDEESSIRHFLSLILQGSGIDTEEFAESGAMLNAIGAKTPDIVFIDVPLEAVAAIENLNALGNREYRGAVQLMSHRGSAVLERVKGIGEQNNLRMLPVLKKPFDAAAIQKIIHDLKIGTPRSVAARIGLDEALSNRWVEFWFQPKIDLRRKQLVGAEAVARVRHPQFGVLSPKTFMPGADERDTLAIAELAIANVIRAEQEFSKIGVNLRLSVNIDIAALVKLPLVDMVRSQRPNLDIWPGMIIDLTEQQIVTDIPLAIELDKTFDPVKVKLAIDEFGRGYAELAKSEQVPFVEFKIDRTFVTDCGSDKVNAPICKTVIDLAHHYGSTAVGIGIEKAVDILALLSMGCDYGQGYLLGQPMPEERFLSLLRQRATTQRAASAPVAAA